MWSDRSLFSRLDGIIDHNEADNLCNTSYISYSEFSVEGMGGRSYLG